LIDFRETVAMKFYCYAVIDVKKDIKGELTFGPPFISFT